MIRDKKFLGSIIFKDKYHQYYIKKIYSKSIYYIYSKIKKEILLIQDKEKRIEMIAEFYYIIHNVKYVYTSLTPSIIEKFGNCDMVEIYW